MSYPTLSDQIQRVSAARRKVVTDFMKRRNVVACGVGYKVRGNEQTDEPSIVVSVTQKQPPEALSPTDLIPQAVDGVLTDVVETGEIAAYAVDRRGRMRPVRPGMSIGHLEGSTGTAGCLVRRGGELLLLSNNHVLARMNAAQPGDPVVQPGPADGGTAIDQIGTLAEFVPLHFTEESTEPQAVAADTAGPAGCVTVIAQILSSLSRIGKGGTAQPAPPPLLDNYVDAALARPFGADLVDARIVDVGGTPLGIVEPELGMRVIKSGRTTGLTQGTITQIDVTVSVRYGERVARFVDQIMITPFSQPGDSGALVLDFERNAVGLLFSGSDQIAVANPIRAVLTVLHAELVIESAI